MRGSLALCLVVVAACAGNSHPPADGGADAAAIDGGAGGDADADAGPPKTPCTVHHDCPQGWYCYYGGCVQDPDYPVYHCGKQDTAGNDTCPPGARCVNAQGKTAVCAESTSYVCTDACACGPAHCCVAVKGLSGKRCVKDTKDPWLPGGTAIGGASCVQGTDPTYCFSLPTCLEGRQAYLDDKTLQGKFRAYNRDLKLAVQRCGARSCFGTACNCKPGQQCVDVLSDSPTPGKACWLLSGGSCVSSALAETIFNYKPSDLLPCCAEGCPAGKRCDAGWISDRRWAYKRIVGTCGACGNGTCDPGEWNKTCPKDCSCGDGVCSAGEAKTCYQDCRSCGNGSCDPGEGAGGHMAHASVYSLESCMIDCACGDKVCQFPEDLGGPWMGYDCKQDCGCGDGSCSPFESCAQDCICPDASSYVDPGRTCGDGICDRRACQDLESCQSCPADCGDCAWADAGWSGSSVIAMKLAYTAWGDAVSGIHVGGDTGLYRFDGSTWSSVTFSGSSTPGAVTGIWGTAPGELYVAAGQIYRFDGKTWSKMTLPAGVKSALEIWGRGAKELYATSFNGVLRFDGVGQTWTVAIPFPQDRYPAALWGPPAGDELFLASYAMNGSVPWTIQRCKLGTKSCVKMSWSGAGAFAFWGAQDAAKLTVFAAGSDSSGTPSIWRHDSGAGDKWAPMSLPAGLPKMTRLSTVWGRSTGEIYAAGDGGLILRYDGTSWSLMTSPLKATIEQIWGDSAQTYALVRESGAILRLDKTTQSWSVFGQPTGTTTTSPSPGGGIWGASSSNVHAAVGSRLLWYDGSGWRVAAQADARLHGLAGSSSSDVWAVGGAITKVPPYPAPIVMRFDGAAWSKQPAPKAAGALLDIWVAAGRRFAVGLDGKLWRHDDSNGWKVAAAPQGAAWLAGVSGCGGDKVALVGQTSSLYPGGEKGLVAVYDDNKQSLVQAGVADATHLFDVWCDSTGLVVAVGGQLEATAGCVSTSTEVWYRPRLVTCTGGSSLSCKVASPSAPEATHHDTPDRWWVGLNGIWGSSSSDLYAAGLGGTLLRFDGKAWRHVAVDLRGAGPGCADLLGIWGTTSALFVSTITGALQLKRVVQSKP